MRVLIGLFYLALLATDLALIGLVLCAGGAVAALFAAMFGAPGWLAIGIGIWVAVWAGYGALFGRTPLA